MLPSKKNDLLFLLNILEYIGKIWKYTEGVNNAEELFEINEQMNFNASITLLANIGENVSKLTESIKQEYTNIEWQRIKDFRNRIVHDYDNINMVIYFEIITKELKLLKQDIEKIICDKLKNKIFDIEEINISKNSNYFKYVDFKNIIS